jgi:hypothetical protein
MYCIYCKNFCKCCAQYTPIQHNNKKKIKKSGSGKRGKRFITIFWFLNFPSCFICGAPPGTSAPSNDPLFYLGFLYCNPTSILQLRGKIWDLNLTCHLHLHLIGNPIIHSGVIQSVGDMQDPFRRALTIISSQDGTNTLFLVFSPQSFQMGWKS